MLNNSQNAGKQIGCITSSYDWQNGNSSILRAQFYVDQELAKDRIVMGPEDGGECFYYTVYEAKNP